MLPDVRTERTESEGPHGWQLQYAALVSNGRRYSGGMEGVGRKWERRSECVAAVVRMQ